MDLGIEGKVALVTGGVRGIGAAITLQLVAEGVTVVATTRSNEAIKEFRTEHPDTEGKVVLIETEITEVDLRETLTLPISREIGTISILVNNAGDTLGITDPYCSTADWRRAWRLNTEVPIELSNLVIPAMKEQRWGRIVNITSCAGLENSGPVVFSVTKAALTAYTRSMGRVLASEEPGIVMSAVFPGVVATKNGHWAKVLKENPSHAEQYLRERCPIGRFGREDEISPVVAFYCSQLASFSHGAIVPVDAGQSKHFMSFNYLS
jgi:NAD(P)-dependent dehydrogenase (short-subunit alcohol dehydrogenase family)